VKGSAAVRQAVLVLIFSPPVDHELDHFHLLIRWLPQWLPRGWQDHPALLGSVVELVSASESSRTCKPLATALQVALKRRTHSWRKQAAHIPATLQPAVRKFLLSVLLRRLPFPLSAGLRRRLLEKPDLTLGEIYQAVAAAARLPASGGLRYWRKMVLLASVADQPIPCQAASLPRLASVNNNGGLRVLSWSRRSREEISFLESLICYQTNELTEVFSLAKEVSLRTRRVVLTLHNASLGAATGWGIPSFFSQVPHESATDFLNRLECHQREFIGILPQSSQSPPGRDGKSYHKQIEALFHLWNRRLIRPRLLQDLWALRVSLLLNDLPKEEWRSRAAEAKELLDQEDYSRLTRTKDLAVTFASPTSCRRSLHKTLSWHQKKKLNHPSMFCLLWSLIAVGDELLKGERLPYLVLPIVDKFFISSQRNQDLDYLPLFVEVTGLMGHSPLFLLIDDTRRSVQPSLQLALEQWHHSHDFLGLGVFASGGNFTSSPLATILANAAKAKLFALRPLTAVHNYVSLDALLTRRPRTFLTATAYDSAWKDNLPFLYHGTQVAALAGPVQQPDQFSPTLITSAGPMAFGTYYRWQLRQLALSRLGMRDKSEMTASDKFWRLDKLWREYAELANLL
jgi:hypothetical protein